MRRVYPSNGQPFQITPWQGTTSDPDRMPLQEYTERAANPTEALTKGNKIIAELGWTSIDGWKQRTDEWEQGKHIYKHTTWTNKCNDGNDEVLFWNAEHLYEMSRPKPKPLKTRIYINRHRIAYNKKHPDADPKPPICIRTSKGVEYANAVQLGFDWELKYDPENAICSGATVWLEGTRDGVMIVG